MPRDAGAPVRPRPDPAPGRRWLEPRLALRLGLPLVLGAVLILLAAGAWNLELQRAHLTRLMSASADRIAETIRRSTRDAMLRNDADALHRMIDDLGAQPGIVRIRVFNKEGRIRTSTRPGEVGTLVDIRAEQCYACHQRDRPLDRLERRDRVRVFSAAGGRRILGIIAPIHNEPQCSAACHVHPAGQRVLGVLDVQLSLDSVEESLGVSERQLLGALAASVAAMLALAALLLWRRVLRPLRHFAAAMAQVARGDLGARVPVASRDELGALARSWNAMTEELGRARGELEEWNRTLERRVQDKTAELEQAHERMLAVERMASLGKLAAVVAHELNNPLAGIRTFARLLLRRGVGGKAAPGGAEAGETRRILEMVEAESTRCGDIVRNLLLFGRSAAARFAEADLRPVLERCALLLRHQAALLGLSLEVEPDGALPAVRCDAAQVEQMLLALAMNALEATPAGGRVSLGAHAAPAEDGVVLRVSDTGCGVPPENRERIFEPFFTTKGAGKGVGLGLSVVYGIVSRHGGRLAVEARPGGGTVFTIHLPRRGPGEADGTGVSP